MPRLLQPLPTLFRRGGVGVLNARHPAIRSLDHTAHNGFEDAWLRRFADLQELIERGYELATGDGDTIACPPSTVEPTR